MNPYEHLKAKLKHAQGLDAKFVRCDIEELVSVLEELETLRGCVKASAFQDGYNKAVDDFVEKLSGVRCECCGKFRDHCCSHGNYCFIDEMGEQLKRGGKND